MYFGYLVRWWHYCVDVVDKTKEIPPYEMFTLCSPHYHLRFSLDTYLAGNCNL